MKRIQSTVLASLALVCLPACRMAAMKTPKALSSHAVPTVTEGGFIKEKTFQFGKWQVDDANRGWTEGSTTTWSISIFEQENSQKSQNYRFTLKKSGKAVHKIECTIFQ